MLNPKTQQRELAYVVLIDNIEPIIGSDNCECAVVGGWHIMVRKGQFNVGDPAIYFEIDSKVNSNIEAFSFLVKRNYKIKTQKFTFGGKGNFISQGLLMHAEDFGWEINEWGDAIVDEKGNRHYSVDETRFLTQKLGVTYADAEDNQRKAPSVDKYKKMAQRHPNIFKKSWARWFMKRKWGRKLMFIFFGKKKDKKNGWPAWVSKTDEERIQNMPWILKNDQPWIATEKIDGSSTTFTIKRGKRGKNNFYVCSRNVCFDSIDKPCYYDSNIYWEMAQKYDMFNIMNQMLKAFPDEEWITIQGETYGEGVQRRNYSITGHDLAVFNVIMPTKGRLNSVYMQELMDMYGIPTVPILSDNFYINQFDDVDKILTFAEGDSQLDGKPREGLVFRSQDGTQSFKVVSNEYLLKYHG